ncbi:MAG TPA: hypothetical protein PKC43_07780 [Phycisphaerales bacterium]|nr:hypothetical protein [Phycisphaerales bacterium]HMP37336.1 hypothetical protein [Phycisphaerales bacterium]
MPRADIPSHEPLPSALHPVDRVAQHAAARGASGNGRRRGRTPRGGRVAAVLAGGLLGAALAGATGATARSSVVAIEPRSPVTGPIEGGSVDRSPSVSAPGRHDAGLKTDLAGALQIEVDRALAGDLRERHLADLGARLPEVRDPHLLRALGARNGPRFTRDLEVLSGIVIADGIHVPAGTDLYVEPETVLILTGPSRIDGRIVPLLPGHGAPQGAAPAQAAASDDPIDEPWCAGGLPSEACPTVTSRAGDPGPRLGSFLLYFLDDLVVTGAFDRLCSLPPDLLSGESFLLQGDRSAVGVAGRGGNGLNVAFIGAVGAALLVDGEICNCPGGPGGIADVRGGNGQNCDCGGDACARGGDGGDAGSLILVADMIFWSTTAAMTIRSAGDGGRADALGGKGADCFECGAVGGRGGYAVAQGGDAGSPTRIQIVATDAMLPSAGFVVANMIQIDSSPWGGIANATAGVGGAGGSCLACDANEDHDGGDGGGGGYATATGGRGGDGRLVVAREGNGIGGALASNGGHGGPAFAYGGAGGVGGAGASCPCSFDGWAGFGGAGGEGGNGTADGGVGGGARGIDGVALASVPVSGAGGSAVGSCGIPGPGGNGGSCLWDLPENCRSGGGGIGGTIGIAWLSGGEPGPAEGGAAEGAHGTPFETVVFFCEGGDGPDGIVFCAAVNDCCTPGPQPGCGDPACAANVCEFAPHCCDFQWDGLCAALAQKFCPPCGGGGGDA